MRAAGLLVGTLAATFAGLLGFSSVSLAGAAAAGGGTAVGSSESLRAHHRRQQQSLQAAASAKTAAESGLDSGTKWSTKRVVNAIIADLNNFAQKYAYDGDFIIQAGTAMMAMGCRLDTYREVRERESKGKYTLRYSRVTENPMHDVDVWIPQDDWEALKAAIETNRRGGQPVGGGYEWAPGTVALGNTHELDVRDGRKVWGNAKILSYAKNRADMGIEGDMLRRNKVYSLSCHALKQQKQFLAAQSDCQRAHVTGVDCTTPPAPPLLGQPRSAARVAYEDAVARGAAKRAQDRADLVCLDARMDEPSSVLILRQSLTCVEKKRASGSLLTSVDLSEGITAHTLGGKRGSIHHKPCNCYPTPVCHTVMPSARRAVAHVPDPTAH